MSTDDDLFPPEDEPYTPPVRTIKTLYEMNEAEAAEVDQRWRSKAPRKRGKASTPENNVRKNIERELKKAGIVYRRYNAGFVTQRNEDGSERVIQLGDPGTSDYLCIVTIDLYGIKIGVFTAIEVKAGNNKPTDLQERFLHLIDEHAGIRIIAYSYADIERGIAMYRERLKRRFLDVLLNMLAELNQP